MQKTLCVCVVIDAAPKLEDVPETLIELHICLCMHLLDHYISHSCFRVHAHKKKPENQCALLK